MAQRVDQLRSAERLDGDEVRRRARCDRGGGTGVDESRCQRRVVIEQIERTRVAWVDTDTGGRIHFTAVFRWAEAAETALMRRFGLLDEWRDFPRRRVEA